MPAEDLHARLADAEARAEHAEGELSALRDHCARWEAEKARADKAEAEVERLRAELTEMRQANDFVGGQCDRFREEIAELHRALVAELSRAENAGAERDALKAAIERFRQRHTPHDCRRDHSFAKTPVPCVNADMCRCGSPLPCRELAALAVPESNEEPTATEITDRHGRTWDPHPFVQSRAVDNVRVCICGQPPEHRIHSPEAVPESNEDAPTAIHHADDCRIATHRDGECDCHPDAPTSEGGS